MRLIVCVLALFCMMLASCENKNVKKIDKNDVFTNELNQISFEEVDIYPSFSTCKTSEDAKATKQCFIETLHRHFNLFFENYQTQNDSLNLAIQVDKKGKIRLIDVQSSKGKVPQSLKLNLNQYLETKLPRVYPAQKQGIPVKCNFTLPVVFTNEI